MWEKLEKKDYQKALSYLEENSPFTSSLYGNYLSSGFTYRPFAMRSGIYFIYKEMDEIFGIIAGYNDGNVMVHTKSSHANDYVLEIMGGFQFHSVWGLSGFLPRIAEVSKVAGIPFDSRSLDVMVLPVRIEESTCPGCELVRVDKKFLSTQYVSFIKKCLWEGFGFKSSSLDIKKRMRERTELEAYWFLQDGEEFVAQTHLQAITPAHGYIGGVCTPREKRRAGYAKEIMKRVCDYIRDIGRMPALAVSSTNKAAHTLYEELGFKQVGTMLVYMVEREFKGDENSE